MRRLTAQQVESETKNASLKLTHRALSDVSCLSSFLNLVKLDLSHNCLSTIQSLSPCINLNWLNVAQNKLTSLQGLQCLTNLKVLNAGMNNIRSIEEVQSVTSLRALILNNNNISSLCKLDQLKYLNTLILSNNPIHDIGDSLVNVKSMIHLSCSHCQIEKIGAALRSCINLRRAKFAYNKIVTLPVGLAQNFNLEILDVGNNLIETWSDLKVLSALQKLNDFSLQGNPISQSAKFARKVKKLVPGLRILNSKPIEKYIKDEVTGVKTGGMDHDHKIEAGEAKSPKKKKPKLDSNALVENELISSSDHPICNDSPVVKESKQKTSRPESKKLKAKKKQLADDATDLNGASQQKTKKGVEGQLDGIDDVETPFLDRLLQEKNTEHGQKSQKSLKVNQFEGLVVDHSKKKKKAKNPATEISILQLLPSADEVGLGGPSAWDD